MAIRPFIDNVVVVVDDDDMCVPSKKEKIQVKLKLNKKKQKSFQINNKRLAKEKKTLVTRRRILVMFDA